MVMVYNAANMVCGGDEFVDTAVMRLLFLLLQVTFYFCQTFNITAETAQVHL